jgi:hypothetical protein
MATTDPTNARLRDFDIPVIMPRIDFIPLDDSKDYVFTGDLSHTPPGSPWQPVGSAAGEAG